MEVLSLRFTSVYNADAIVASGVLPWQVMRPRLMATLAISPAHKVEHKLRGWCAVASQLQSEGRSSACTLTCRHETHLRPQHLLCSALEDAALRACDVLLLRISGTVNWEEGMHA